MKAPDSTFNNDSLKNNNNNIGNSSGLDNDNNNNIINKKRKRIKNECDDNEKKVNNNTKNNYNILNIHFYKDLITDSYITDIGLDNIFCLFKSINNIIYLIYANDDISIIVFNFIDHKKITEIKNAHENYITNFRHFFDIINQRDLVLSISGFDNNVQIWNINSLERLANIKEIYNEGELYSACFLKDNNEIYIITCHDKYPDSPEPIKIFSLNGKKNSKIKESKERSFFIDSYYDEKTSNNYIIVGNKYYVKSYSFDKKKLYRKYLDENDFEYHCSIIIYKNDDKEIIKLIDSSNDGNIRIWNFHTAELLKKIKVTERGMYRLYGICLWSNEYLFVGCNDKSIKLIELNSGKIVKSLIANYLYVLTIKKIYHPLYGECLISKGGDYDPITLWIIKN